MMRPAHLLLAACLMPAIAAPGLARGFEPRASVANEQLHVRLVTSERSVEAGRALHLGLRFDLSPGWYLYSQDARNVGRPPTVDWILPPGLTAGPIQWPASERFEKAGLVQYGYTESVVLPVTFHVAPEIEHTPDATIAANVEWVACSEQACVPGKALLGLELGAGAASMVEGGHPVTTPLPRADAANRTLWAALALAFAGGLLLNLMPCVFPVLSLKILGFIDHADSDPRRIRRHGWAYTAGVLTSFWTLAGILAVLRASGEKIGWGFQLQSPVFVSVTAMVLLLLALALVGVVELGLPLTRLATIDSRLGRGYFGSFWIGALATVVATPCTAPFMGPAIGYALTQPLAEGLVVFTALGTGMALPYLALSHTPSTLARLPRPGPWMAWFRRLLALPLLATVLWLLQVFARQTSTEAAWRLMTGLLVLAAAGWLWGITQRRSGVRLAAAPAAIALALSSAAIGISAARAPAVPVGAYVEHDMAAAAHASSSADDGIWEPWSPERVEELRAEGVAVFVEFTADWCLTCKINERLVFSTESVRKLFREHAVAALKADWTRNDERITEALASFGREGVPLYVVYPACGAAPRVLGQVPSYAALRGAIAGEHERNAPMPAPDLRSCRWLGLWCS